MTEFQVRTKKGLKTVQGYIVGRFGFHFATDGKWTITHLPTGFAAARARNDVQCREFCEVIDRFPEWNELTWDEPDEKSKIIFDIPQRLTKRMFFTARQHGVELTSGSVTS